MAALLQAASSTAPVDPEKEPFQTLETTPGCGPPYLAARVFGNVAVVRLQPYRLAVAGQSLGRSGEFAVVDVWTRDGDAWKLSARHLSRPAMLKR